MDEVIYEPPISFSASFNPDAQTGSWACLMCEDEKHDNLSATHIEHVGNPLVAHLVKHAMDCSGVFTSAGKTEQAHFVLDFNGSPRIVFESLRSS